MKHLHLERLDQALQHAVADGCDPADLLAELAARHLMSDEADPAHVNGIAFAERFNAALAAKAGGGGT
ncbi:hypothetical protein Aergia_0088 [Pseudomonas phage Aergia]|jgi:hypothetical protein|nr:hypothetical protein 38_00067 [Pseudomonas phage Epa38]WPK38671.1 hypothetical protein Aergia_0088 [Pseudomonas phage Aergia]